MNKVDNRRARITKQLFHETLLELMQQKSVTEISVREICQVADMNRSTFYLHYKDVYDLLEEMEDEVLDEFAAHIRPLRLQESSFIDAIAELLENMKAKRHVFGVLMNDPNYGSFRDRCMSMLMNMAEHKLQVENSDRERCVYKYIVHGGAHIIMDWTKSNYAMDCRELAELLQSLALSSVSALYGAKTAEILSLEKGSAYEGRTVSKRTKKEKV